MGNCQNPQCSASIKQDGSQLVFTNEACGSSRGTINGTEVVAYDWGNLIGDVSPNGDTIMWRNPTKWVRITESSQSMRATAGILVAHEFHVTEGGGFINKTLKEMGSQEFQAIVTVACAAYGVDCSSAAGAIRKGAEVGSPIVGRAGGRVYITGTVTKHEGKIGGEYIEHLSAMKSVMPDWTTAR
jgi:hypothetical protein